LHHYRQARRILVLIDDTTDDNSRDIVLAAGREVRPYSILELDGHSEPGGSNTKGIRNNVWKESRGLVDWVITQDPDEFLHFPEYPGDIASGLNAMQNKGYQAIKLTAYNMFCTDEEWEKIDPTKPIHEQLTRGKRIRNIFSRTTYDKINVFNPNIINETKFHVGAHFWSPDPADIKIAPAINIAKMLHLKHTGPKRELNRRIKYRNRILPTSLVEMGIGGAYIKTDEEHANEISTIYSAPDIVDLTVPSKPSVLCVITHKNRYDALAQCLQSIDRQTIKPDLVAIYDDSIPKENISTSLSCPVAIIYTSGIGAHEGHQISNTSGYDLVWRLHDDCIAEPDVLEKLLSRMTPEVGAVSGIVCDPDKPGKIHKDVRIESLATFDTGHIQLDPDSGVYDDVDFLHTSFLYRANIVNYKDTNISPIGYHEDTIFTHRLKRAGYKLVIDTAIKTKHILYPTGGRKLGSVEWRTSAHEWDYAEFLKIMREEWNLKV
jgi:hypothetical protein